MKIKPDPRIPAKIAESLLFRTLTRIFEEEFGLPVFLNSRAAGFTRMPLHQASFCQTVNAPRATCSRCPARKIPSIEKLEPWVWSRQCAAGLTVTAAPVRLGRLAVEWLITGHVIVDRNDNRFDESFENLTTNHPRSLEAGELREKYGRIRRITPGQHQAVTAFLQGMGEMLGASINSLMIKPHSSDSPWLAAYKKEITGKGCQAMTHEEVQRFTHESGMSPNEYDLRHRIENARKIIASRFTNSSDIRNSVHNSGFSSPREFAKAFHGTFNEYPMEHRKRMRTAQDNIVRSITNYSQAFEESYATAG